jgi:AcrR family transcriptional regulator
MGNREDLLRGATEALLDVGYARSTAREIAGRAGTSLGAITYHFGTTEALLHAAIVQGFADGRDRLVGALAPSGGPPSLARIGEELDALFDEERKVFAAMLEGVALAGRTGTLSADAARSYEEDRDTLAGMLAELRGSSLDHDRLLASTLMALVDGLFIQRLIDPSAAPSVAAVLELLEPILAPTGRRRGARA